MTTCDAVSVQDLLRACVFVCVVCMCSFDAPSTMVDGRTAIGWYGTGPLWPAASRAFTCMFEQRLATKSWSLPVVVSRQRACLE